MSNTITCPNCSTSFEPTAVMEQAITEKFRAEYNAKWAAQKKKQDEEIQQREAIIAKERLLLEESRKQVEEELGKRVQEAVVSREEELRKSLTEKISGDLGQKLRFLEDNKKEQEAALKASRQKELEFLQREEEFKKREELRELEKQKEIASERNKIMEEQRRTEEERFRLREEASMLKMKEYETSLESQKKLIADLQRKAEQGSMQLQGEAQELALEELLRRAFPFDIVREVGKGIRGADCILTVRNSNGKECGCIIFESKRTKDFGSDWVAKLKGDMMGCKADIAVIVTQAFPKDMERFGERDGVYVCSFSEVKSLVGVLRAAILKLYEARKNEDNKGEKMAMLYNYITGSEYMAKMNAMRESFGKLREMLQKERDDFEKNFKKKLALIETITTNSSAISGTVEGFTLIDLQVDGQQAGDLLLT